MTNFERLQTCSREELASSIAALMAYVAVDEADLDDWSVVALLRDRYKAWLLNVWLKKENKTKEAHNERRDSI